MIARSIVGKGVTGLGRYVLGEGRGAGNDNLATGEPGRVVWIGGQGFGFDINTRERAELAIRIMEFDALNQTSRTKQCEKDALHLMLAWRTGQTPTRREMEAAARSALKALGMENAKTIWAEHRDEDHAHLHIVASKINPETGRAYNLKSDYLKLSKWAEQYEREHGGIVCLRRLEANKLREAIDNGDPAAVLDAMTHRRATFTRADLERALARQIGGELTRAQFGNTVLDHAEVVRLADTRGGATTRYTTRSVLESEGQVLQAVRGLARADHHAVGARYRDQVLESRQFAGMRDDQRRAFDRATGAAGLTVIDGQAGTGKSYALTAIREAYEAKDCTVIGLAPTNAIAQDMARDGFRHAGTIHSELFALNNARRRWDTRTVVMVDEAAMIDTKLMAALTGHARDAGAKLILVGDDRQLSSIDRGGMFAVLKDRYGAASLTGVTRQHKDEDRRAASMMAEGNFADALAIYKEKGAIHWTRTQGQARAALVEQWAKDSAAAPDKSRLVFAYTNDDVAALNADLRAVRRERGELGPDHQLPTADGQQSFAAGDRLQFTRTDRAKGLFNGAAGKVQAIDGSRVTVQLDGRRGATVSFDAVQFGGFRHGYAGTIYKGQGRTLDQTYLYHSEHWRSAASYVALTRHREKAEVFVATNTARDVTQLARQMARVDDRRAASQFHPQGEPIATDAARSAIHTITTPSTDTARGQRAMSDVTQEAGTNPEIDDAERRQVEARRQQALKDATERTDRLAREQADRLVAQADEMKLEHERIIERQRQIDAYHAELQRIADEDRKRRAAEEAEIKEAEIRDAQSRYAQALGDHYDVRDPYGSLARASMAEYGRFKRDREELNRQIAAETDRDRRKTLELRRDIEAADYMSITSHRIAGQSEDIVGRSNTDEAIRQREQAARFEAEARELRRQYREQVAEQELAKDTEAREAAEPSDSGRVSRHRGPRTSRGRTSQEQTAEAGDQVVEAEEADPGAAAEPRRRAQRGERTAQEIDQEQDLGPDLER